MELGSDKPLFWEAPGREFQYERYETNDNENIQTL